MSLDVVPALLAALKPFSYYAWLAAGALVFWLIPQQRRRQAALPISLAILLLGEGRPWLLPAVATLIFIAVYAITRARVRAGRPTTLVVAGVVGLYASLHFLFGLITFTDVLAALGAPVAVADDLRTMDARIFTDAPMLR